MSTRALLAHTAARAADFLEGLASRPLRPTRSAEQLRRVLGGPVPRCETASQQVIDELIDASDPGLLGSPSGRFFGFVIGGALPVALAADWLTSTWDQNAGLFVAGPAASVVEEVCGAWIAELVGLPPGVSFALVTGCQMAHFTTLAAARHHLLGQAGFDVERDGLAGAPQLRVIVGEERHATVDRAIRFLGIGTRQLRVIGTDAQGRMDLSGLRKELSLPAGPTIVCAQAGNVNTGAFDDIGAICELSRPHSAWVHVDGAFGLWAGASRTKRALLQGCEKADSWAMDAHKWLNVPYDSGLAFVAHPGAHRASMSIQASYLQYAEGQERDQVDWTPEFSRRARGFALHAAIRALGSEGIEQMVDRCCDHAVRFARLLGSHREVEVLNTVFLNQVLVRFLDPNADHDSRTQAVVRRVQQEGTCWASGTRWKGNAAMRISVSNWSTTDQDVDAAVASILAAVQSEAATK